MRLRFSHRSPEVRQAIMKVEVRATPFNPWQELETYLESESVLGREHGASVVFVGTVRDFCNQGPVSGLELEHYPGMTEAHLRRLSEEAMEKWPIQDLLLIHRTGVLAKGDPIVLTAVWSAHRDDAYLASRYIIEELKSRAPFWKKEKTTGGEHWVVRS